MKLSIEVRDTVSQRLRDAAGRFKDLKPYWRDVAKQFFEIERRLFASEGGSGASGRWARLRPSTLKEKAKAGYGGKPILQRTGALMQSLTREGGAGQIYRETATSLTIDTDIPYAVYHKKGTRKMEARPPISITEGQARQLMQPLKRGLANSIQRLGFTVTGE